MGTFIAVIIIIALIFYALRDLLIDRDFSVWTNIALTSLILFTVILSIFMILHKQPAPDDPRVETEKEKAPVQTSTEEQGLTEEEVLMDMADRYAVIENDCIKNNAGADCAGFTNDFLKKAYDLSDEDFDGLMGDPNFSDLLQKARAAQNEMKVQREYDDIYIVLPKARTAQSEMK
jgi:hypothetical protein